MIPYDGYLMLDSAPVNAQNQQLEFALFESASGGTAQWVETHTVSIYNGKFSVALGKGTKVSSTPSNATFGQVVLDAEKLFLSIKVEDAAGNPIELSGRQAIEAAPYAAWSANASDFQVAGDLAVQGNTTMGGTLDVNGGITSGGQLSGDTLDVSGGVTAGGQISGGTLDVSGGITSGGQIAGGNLVASGDLNVGANAHIAGHDLVLGTNTARGNGGRALVEGQDRLLINFDEDFSNGTEVQGDFTVLGLATVSENFVASANQHDSCSWTSWERKGNTTTATPPTGGNFNQLICPAGKYVVGMDFTHRAGEDFTFQEYYRLRCCAL